MKINYKKSGKVAKTGLTIAGLVLFTKFVATKTLDNYFGLSDTNFKNAEWIKKNVSWEDAYNSENIPHNRTNYNFYKSKLAEKFGDPNKAYAFPDLDEDGK